MEYMTYGINYPAPKQEVKTDILTMQEINNAGFRREDLSLLPV